MWPLDTSQIWKTRTLSAAIPAISDQRILGFGLGSLSRTNNDYGILQNNYSNFVSGAADNTGSMSPAPFYARRHLLITGFIFDFTKWSSCH